MQGHRPTAEVIGQRVPVAILMTAAAAAIIDAYIGHRGSCLDCQRGLKGIGNHGLRGVIDDTGTTGPYAIVRP